MNKTRILPLIIGALALFAQVCASAAPRWPSARYAGYLTSSGTAESYRWDAEHYDFIDSGPLDAKQYNPALPVTFYMVLRYLTSYNIDLWHFLREYSEARGANLEDMFIHYSEDTVLNMNSTNRAHPEDDFLTLVHYAGGAYQHRGDWWSSVQQFTFGSSVGEILYLGMLTKFDEINFALVSPASGSWNALWEYWNGSSWSALSVTDTTNNLRSNGRVGFTPPANWKRAALGGGDSRIANEPIFLVRLRVAQTGAAPQLKGSGSLSSGGIQAADYIPLVDPTPTDSSNDYYRVPGWDEAADVNKDGYLDAAEWPNRAANKNARFKYWARTTGSRYANFLSWGLNVGNPLFRDAIVAYIHQVVATPSNGFTFDGVYFDDSMAGFDPGLYNETPGNPISGGSLYEYPKPGIPDPSVADTVWNNDYVTTLARVRQDLTAVGKLTGINLGRSDWPEAERSVDYIMRELAYYSQSNYGHIAALGDQWTLASIMKRDHATGVISIVQHQKGLTNYLGYTQQVLDREKYLGLAVFYTLQDPRFDYFNSWTGTYYTSAQGPGQFVPAVAADIGRPTGVIPTGYTAITGPDSNMFLFASGTDPATTKTYKIIGRDYSKGMVIAKPKPDFASNDATAFGDGSATTHTLPVTADNPTGRYFLVRYDGTVETTSRTSITLRNAEAAILIKESALGPAPSIAITNAVSPTSPKPGDTVTYTITCRNSGTAAANNVVVRDTLPAQLTYVVNSTTLNGAAVSPDPVSGNVLTLNLGTLIVGQTASITLQARVK